MLQIIATVVLVVVGLIALAFFGYLAYLGAVEENPDLAIQRLQERWSRRGKR